MEENLEFGHRQARPVLISIICIIGFLFSLFNIVAVLFLPNDLYTLNVLHGEHYPVVTLIVSLVSLVAYFAIWRMRIWGVFLFAAAAILLALYGWYIQSHFWWEYAQAFIILIICFFYVRYME